MRKRSGPKIELVCMIKFVHLKEPFEIYQIGSFQEDHKVHQISKCGQWLKRTFICGTFICGAVVSWLVVPSCSGYHYFTASSN